MNKIIIICGPTACGKSALALELGSSFSSDIINADSIQLYRDLPILSAQPSNQDKRLVPHFLYEVLDPREKFSVGQYIELAKEQIDEALKENKTPIVVGGTGLYINGLIDGISPIPEVSLESRLKAREEIENLGNEHIYNMLVVVNSDNRDKFKLSDTQRLSRAYEVYLETGKDISYWQNLPKTPKFDRSLFIIVKLNPERSWLYNRINQRFDQMLELGVIEEVGNFVNTYGYNENLIPTKAAGFREIYKYIKGDINLQEAIIESKKQSRRYAKRQYTWFNHQLEGTIIDYSSIERALSSINSLLR